MRVLIVGLGARGRCHALAHHDVEGVEIIGLVSRTARSLPLELGDYPLIPTLSEGLALRPDLVVVASVSQSHSELAERAMRAGANVFVETPLADSVTAAERVVATARQTGKKLIVAAPLRHHPSWARLIEEARALGGPFAFRTTHNRRLTGRDWVAQQALMKMIPLIVESGVPCVDVWRQITQAEPVAVQAIGMRLDPALELNAYNYAQFQVMFEDGSVGWHEGGCGPMIPEGAARVRDVICPQGSVSIADGREREGIAPGAGANAGSVLVQSSGSQEVIAFGEEPDAQLLCNMKQAYVRSAVREDLDLSQHHGEAIGALQVSLAAYESIQTGRRITFGDDASVDPSLILPRAG